MRTIVRALAIALLFGCAQPARRDTRVPAGRAASPFAYEHYLAAEIESAHGRSAAAIRELRRAIASDPTSSTLRVRLAVELGRLGRLEAAATEARAAAAVDPGDPEPYLLLGEIAWRRGDGAGARAAVRAALGREPRLERAYRRLADWAFSSGGEAAVATAAREWVERIPESAEGWCRLGQATANLGNAGPAADAYARCLEIDPRRTRARLRMAELLDAAGKTDAAVATLREAQARTRDALPVLELLVPLLSRLGREREAVTLLDQLDQAEADGGEAPITVGYLYLAALRPRRAEEIGRVAMARTPPPPRAALLVADALAARGERAAALEVLERMGPGSPREAEAGIRVVALLREAGRIDEALALAQRLARDRPSLAAPHELAANCLVATGDMTGALAEVREALRREPGRPSSLSLLGVIQMETGGRFEDAESLARRALAAQPGSAQILHDLGWILFKAGRLDEGRRYLESAARTDPGSHTIRRHLEQLRSRASAPGRRSR